MKRSSALLVTVLAMAFWLQAETDAAACTCMSPKRPTCEVWWQTSAIFVGRVTTVRTVSETTSDGHRVSKLVTMRVRERWQGVKGERDVVVGTGAGGGDCGFEFEQGKTYLVYAGQSSTSGRLETGICSRTALVEQAEADLAYLRQLETADKIVSLYGMVYRDRQAREGGTAQDEELDRGGPMPGVEITIQELTKAGNGTAKTLNSDTEGWYEFEHLHPGRYEIRLNGPDIGANDRWRFRIPVGPACIWRNIIVDPLPQGEREGAAEAEYRNDWPT